ncbi:unnamed protein product [Lupinus luteus]|uniref:Uncharacterized protein n=1 Tax=Lupinus luteus TaxID=3873 RepID=A0AAV1XNH2_LUPLU
MPSNSGFLAFMLSLKKCQIEDVFNDSDLQLLMHGQPKSNLDQTQQDSILKWLNEKPPSSIIYLYFGSWGSLCPPETRESALVLQRSGVKFMMVKQLGLDGDLRLDYRLDNELVMANELRTILNGSSSFISVEKIIGSMIDIN